MVAPLSGAPANASFRLHQQRERHIEILKQRFEVLGVEYTKGFMAAHIAGRPRWRVKLAELVQYLALSTAAVVAARALLKENGIDPWQCGSDLFQSGVGIEKAD